MSEGKTLWIVAGPNGAGKTTLRQRSSTFNPWPEDMEWIDPDVIAKTLSPEDHHNIGRVAARIAIEKINECIAAGKSFGTEATLSASYHNNLAKQLRAEGWKVCVIYIGLESSDLSLKRVDSRIAEGGHDISETGASRDDTVHRRFNTSVKKLSELVQNSDEAYLLDNSKASGFELIAVGKNGVLKDLRKNDDKQLKQVTSVLRSSGVLLPQSWANFLEDPLVDEAHKTIWIIAGPNGAGKSTFIASPWSSTLKTLPFINTDNIARQINPDNPNKAIFEAGRKAFDLMDQHVAKKESFVVETTLSGNSYLNLMQKLKAKGWKVGLIYVSLANPELARERIAHRVSFGGHYVSPQDTERRWPRTADNVIAAATMADSCHILDNSGETYLHVAHGNKTGLQDLRDDKEVLPDLMKNLETHGILASPKEEKKNISLS